MNHPALTEIEPVAKALAAQLAFPTCLQFTSMDHAVVIDIPDDVTVKQMGEFMYDMAQLFRMRSYHGGEKMFTRIYGNGVLRVVAEPYIEEE